jgi:hypothetical protein
MRKLSRTEGIGGTFVLDLEAFSRISRRFGRRRRG